MTEKNNRKRISFIAAIGLAAALAAQLTSSASAQPVRPMMGIDDAFRSDFLERDMAAFVEILQLTEDQQLLVETLFADYDAAFDKGAETIRKQMSELRGPGPDEQAIKEQREIRKEIREAVDEMRRAREKTDDVEKWRQTQEEFQARLAELRDRLRSFSSGGRDQEAREQMRREIDQSVDVWKVEKAALKLEFITQVKSVLTEEQQPLWPVLERKLNREKTVPRGELSGESVDVIAVFEGLTVELPEATVKSVWEMLQEYALRLDVLLKARNEYFQTSGRELEAAVRDRDHATALAVTDRLLTLRKGVRDVNDEFATLVELALEGEAAVEFRDAVNLKGYPRVFRPTRAAKMFDAAAELADLDEEVATAVAELQNAYLTELGPRNLELKQITRAYEPAQHRRRYERLSISPEERGPGRPEIPNGETTPIAPPTRPERWKDPIREAYNDRDKLDDQYIARLKALLAEGQFENLPGTRAGRVGAGGREGRRDWVKEFDSNGDGRLDEAERDALRDYLRNRYQRPDGK